MASESVSGPGPGKTPTTGTVTPGLPCGHSRAMAILHRDGRTAWCFICETNLPLESGRR